jgi:SAM-dependent methyltransferase
VELHPATRGFEDPSRYERARPDYPPAAVDWLLERTTPGADVGVGRADALPVADAGVHAVVAGQAFHGFATAATLGEFARVLTPGGRLGLAWNRRDLSISFVAALPARDRGAIEAEVRALAPPAPIELRYVTELSVYSRSRSGSSTSSSSSASGGSAGAG